MKLETAREQTQISRKKRHNKGQRSVRYSAKITPKKTETVSEWIFEMINKIGRLLARLTKKKRKWHANRQNTEWKGGKL